MLYQKVTAFPEAPTHAIKKNEKKLRKFVMIKLLQPAKAMQKAAEHQFQLDLNRMLRDEEEL